MGRRHGRTAPYEIMTRVGGGQPLPQASPVRRVRGGSVGLWGMVTSGLAGLTRQLKGKGGGAAASMSRDGGGGGSSFADKVTRPVQMTLPRGLLALGAFAAVVLLGLTFFAGQFIAGRSGMNGGATVADGGGAVAAHKDAGADPDFAPTPDGPVVAMGATAGTQLDPAEVPGGAIAVQLPRTDPRVPGLNYLMLVTVRAEDIDEARRLQEFLRRQGVATILAKSNNGRFVQVVDVSASFSSDEYRAGQYQPHLEKMRAMGRAWKRHNNNIGSDLGSMTFYKFKGDFRSSQESS